MKTKNLKKVLSLALLGSMMVSMLGACGNSSEKSGSSAGKASTASVGKSSTAIYLDSRQNNQHPGICR